MSGKIIKVESCEVCPRLTWRNLVEPYCTLMNMKIIDISKYPIIPSWCSLEDDLTPALDILQGYLEKNYYIDYEYGEHYGGKNVFLFQGNGDLFASGKTIKELLINLINLDKGSQ